MSRFGLLPRIVIALGAAALLPLLVASVQLVRVNTDAMLTQVLKTHSVAARATSERIAAHLDALRASGLSLGGTVAVAPSEAAGDLLAAYLSANRDVLGLVLVDRDGAEALRAQRRGSADEVSTAVTLPVSAWPRVVDTAPGRRLLLDLELEAGGWLRLISAIDTLEATLHPEDLGEDARLCVITSGAEPVLGGELDAGGETYPPSLLQSAVEGRIGGAGRYPGPHGDVVGAFNPIAGTTWIVLSRQPAIVAERTAHRMRQRAALAVVVALAVAGALAVGAYQTLVRPLRGLVSAQRKLAGLEENGGRSGHEIDRLRDSLAVLEDRAADREDLDRVFLGRYQVIEVIGQGAMGSVFRGWDPKLKREVALKTIRLAAGADRQQELATSLVREAITVARFSHPNIVAVYDVEDSPEGAFVAMEYIDGPSLQAHLKSLGKLSAAETTMIGLALGQALAAAHERGLVHHDVKPGNVLLGHDGAIKIADFGIARGVTAMTNESKTVYGTPGYLPCETLLGEGYDEKGDLFALGAVLYECLAGRRPYTGRTVQEIASRTVAGATDPIHSLCTNIPDELARLVMALIAADKERRPGSAAAVAEVLSNLAQVKDYGWMPPFRESGKSTRKLEVRDALSASQLMSTRIRSRG